MDKNVLVYEGDKGVRLMVKCDGETVWLTQEQMSAPAMKRVTGFSKEGRE